MISQTHNLEPNMPQACILVLESEAAHGRFLVEYLAGHGFCVIGIDNSMSFWKKIERELPELVLVGVRFPGEAGVSIVRRLRARSSRIGIILLTGLGSADERIIGLEVGADDCMSMPIEQRELLARVRSILRRTGRLDMGPTSSPQIRVGRRVLDTDRHLLLDGTGAEEPLTASEFDLLQLLVENPDRPLARDWLLQRTSHREARSFDRSIDLRITRLRRKIEYDPAHPEAIRTVRNVGYMFVPAKQ